MRLMFAFIKWIFSKLGESLIESHQSFRRGLRREPGIHVVGWFFFSLLSSILVMLILVGVQYVTGLQIPVQLWLSYVAGCVIYLIFTAVNIMYNAFKEERRELFETIKNGH